MGSRSLLAIISGGTAVLVATITAVLTYTLSKRREREADWRKVKLEYYRAYISAVAGIVEGRATSDSHLKYTDAYNTLALVGSPDVLAAAREYQREISIKNAARSALRHDELYSALVNALRNDITPLKGRHDGRLSHHMITLRPDLQPTTERSE